MEGEVVEGLGGDGDVDVVGFIVETGGKGCWEFRRKWYSCWWWDAIGG